MCPFKQEGTAARAMPSCQDTRFPGTLSLAGFLLHFLLGFRALLRILLRLLRLLFGLFLGLLLGGYRLLGCRDPRNHEGAGEQEPGSDKQCKNKTPETGDHTLTSFH